MNFSNLIRIALLAIKRNKLRAFLTMLGIIIGVASVIAMMAIGEGSKESISSSLSSMGSNMITIMPSSNVQGGVKTQGSSFQTLKITDVDAIKQNVSNIAGVSPVASSNGQAINGSQNWPTSMQGVSPDYLQIRQLKVKDGVMFSETDIASYAKVCLIGKTVVDNLFPAGENPIGKIIRFGKIPFQVIGVLDEKGQSSFGQDQDDIILAPYSTVQKRITASIYFQSIYVSASSQEASEDAQQQITATLRQSHRLGAGEEDDFSIRTQAELIKTIGSTSSMLTVLLTAIASISLLIGGIGIMNIMYVSVTERTKEIGLRMSIGARGGDILLQFLLEAVLLSVLGGLIGVALGITSSKLITAIFNWPTVISQTSIMVSFLVCVITGVFFGYYPAQRASRLDPIEALRYE